MIKTKSILAIKGEGIIFDDVKVVRHDDDNEASKYDVYDSYGKHLVNGFADDVAYFLNHYYDLLADKKTAIINKDLAIDFGYVSVVGNIVLDDNAQVRFNVGDEVEVLKEVREGFWNGGCAYVIYNPKNQESATVAKSLLDFK